MTSARSQLERWPRLHGAGRAMSRTNAAGKGASATAAAYKRLTEVLAEHGDQTIRVTHTLRPLGVAMAGADTFDPFKD